jgi:hypothetical protein
VEKRTLRLSLSDIAGRDTEEDIIYILQKIKEGLLFEFQVWLWYTEKCIPNDTIEKFKDTYASQLCQLNANIRHLNGYEEFVWYDVINTNDCNLLKKYKFRLTYNLYTQLPNSLIEFSTFAKSYNNRNGHRHVAKNSFSRVSKVG